MASKAKWLVNKLGLLINPSTEDKQDSIISGLDSVGISKINDARINPSTEDKQDTLVSNQTNGNQRVKINIGEGLSISKGDVSGVSFIHKFGEALDIDTADGFVDIWDGLGITVIAKVTNYTFSTSADIDSISSSNAGDTEDIEILGLDANYNEVTQTVTLSGQDRVALSTALIRVYRMTNRGSSDLVGEVFCYPNTAITSGVPNDTSKIRAVINNGNNQTLMAIYTVPAGKTGYLRCWYAATSSKLSGFSIVKIKIRPFGEVFQLKHITGLNSDGTSNIHHKYEEPEILTEKSDIIFQADTSINNMAVAAGFDIVLIDN